MLYTGSLMIKTFEHIKLRGKRDDMLTRDWTQFYCTEMLTQVCFLLLENDTVRSRSSELLPRQNTPFHSCQCYHSQEMVKKATSKYKVQAIVESNRYQRGWGPCVAQCGIRGLKILKATITAVWMQNAVPSSPCVHGDREDLGCLLIHQCINLFQAQG